MDTNLWQQTEALYNSALELHPAERADFLAVACAGDETLRREVISLLSAAERADSFLEEPAVSLGLALMEGRRESLTGKTVGRYKLLELLGRGGMGEVYLAFDHRLNRRIALKLLPSDFSRDRERVRRFEQEARAASAISHPNVAHIYEIGEEQGWHYITMEHVRGRTLREVIKQGPLGGREALDIAAQIASALEAAHEAGIIHRDIKPENVMLRDDGYAKVLDFRTGQAHRQRAALCRRRGRHAALLASHAAGAVDGDVGLYVAGAAPPPAVGRTHRPVEPGRVGL
jgi:eukaryotic-like serine/threonine-protein kinase